MCRHLIFLLLLDLSANIVNREISTRSSMGIEPHSTGWRRVSPTDLSGLPAVARCPNQLVTGVPQGSVLGPQSLLHLHHVAGSHHLITCFFFHCYADETQLSLSLVNIKDNRQPRSSGIRVGLQGQTMPVLGS